jgi:hypothetical protein
MKCEEYRRICNRRLDERNRSPLAAEAELHVRDCPRCNAYARAMFQIDAGLRSLPEVQVPEEVLASALSEGGRCVGPGRELLNRVGRGVAAGFPPAIAWSLGGLLHSPSDTAMQFLLVSAAVALFALTALRPRLSA